jgi:hypothetical protein
MENLTHSQISMVVDWMNGWEQLRDTVIPIRFKEAFESRIKEINRPPLGLMPKWIYDDNRKQELIAAICRYSQAGLKIPQEWSAEFKGLLD